VTFLPRRQQETQQRIRAEQATADWRQRYALRCGVESLISQASRLSDLHQARYRGLVKTHLQHVLTALALNLVRVESQGGSVPSWLVGRLRLGLGMPAPSG
jgi:IS5 family transposase